VAQAAGIDGNDHVHDDDVRAGRRPGIACSTEDHVDWAINEAARHGHVGVVRWLTTRRILGVDRTDLFDEDESALAMAMYRMQPAVVMYIHDRMAGQGGFPQEYHDNTVRWMWRAPRPGIVRMVIEHAWAVVEPPKAEDIAYMIRERHHDMLLYALDRYPLPPVAVMEPRWRTELESAVAHAARSGHTDTVRLAIQRGLCASLGPVVAGAADGGRIDVLEWVTADEPELCMAAMPPLTVLDMRTAAAAATTAGSVAALEWLVKRFGADLVGPHHVHAAFHCGKLSVVRFLDSLLLAPTGAPFPWGDMVARALLSPLRLPVLRFLVEEKGARVEPHHIASVARPDPEVVRYVLSRFGPSVFQDAVSLMGARQLSSDAASIRHICGIVPGLCVSVAAAMGADERLSPYSSDDDDDDLITMCECAACVALVGVPAADALASCSRKRRCDDADRADRASDGSEDGRDRCDPLKRRRIDA
jgi:hypothetical protein